MNAEPNKFLDQAHDALHDPVLQGHLKLLGFALTHGRTNAVEQLGQFEELRTHVKRVRDHTLHNLDHYLRQYEEQVVLNGGHVHWARNAQEYNDIVLQICRQHDARTIGKGKSMVTEETHLREHLQEAGLEVTETDLGEYIIQMADEPPSHIVGPALHKSADEIRELFYEVHPLGERELSDPPEMVQEARGVLREKFLAADIGIIGANALIAENGSNMLVTNEGNGDLVSSLPKVQIVCASIDKLLPRAEDATALLRLLARSAVGATISSYTSFYSGPRRDEDEDGPEEFHVVLLDNGRSDNLGGKYQDMLECMRCGACLNHCPIYIGTGGHAYGSVYQGPMGSVLTPLLNGLEDASVLPNACTSCGRCAEVCPAKIPLPDLLRELRTDEWENKIVSRGWRVGLSLHALVSRFPGLYQFCTSLAIKTMRLIGRRRSHLRSLGVKNGWTQERDFPAPEGDTFMQQWKQKQKSEETEQ